jgi:hypothetical protein
MLFLIHRLIGYNLCWSVFLASVFWVGLWIVILFRSYVSCWKVESFQFPLGLSSLPMACLLCVCVCVCVCQCGIHVTVAYVFVYMMFILSFTVHSVLLHCVLFDWRSDKDLT